MPSFSICLPAFLGCQGQPACTQGLGAKIWVGRYQEIEEYLRTAECVSMEVLLLANVMRCTLRPGGPVARMAWRALPPGVHRGFCESYRAEIAAYELDKLLKMDMVPPSVERQIQGNKGARPTVGGERRRRDGPRVARRVRSEPTGKTSWCG